MPVCFTTMSVNLAYSLYLSEEIIRSSEGIPFKAGDSPIQGFGPPLVYGKSQALVIH